MPFHCALRDLFRGNALTVLSINQSVTFSHSQASQAGHKFTCVRAAPWHRPVLAEIPVALADGRRCALRSAGHRPTARPGSGAEPRPAKGRILSAMRPFSSSGWGTPPVAAPPRDPPGAGAEAFRHRRAFRLCLPGPLRDADAGRLARALGLAPADEPAAFCRNASPKICSARLASPTYPSLARDGRARQFPRRAPTGRGRRSSCSRLRGPAIRGSIPIRFATGLNVWDRHRGMGG